MTNDIDRFVIYTTFSRNGFALDGWTDKNRREAIAIMYRSSISVAKFGF